MVCTSVSSIRLWLPTLAAFLLLSASAGAVPIVGGPIVYSGHTYYKLDVSTWHEAEATAVGLGGHLVTINDEAENMFIYSTFADPENPLWIGLNDEASEGNFVWVSGETVTYTKWFGEPDTEPNDAGTGEDFGSMLETASSSTGEWNDIDEFNVIYQMQGIVEVIPEPNTALLLGFGLLGLGIKRRRQAVVH